MAEDDFQTTCRQLLKTKRFKGFYKEIKRVDKLNDYRDVIVVDKNETELIENLKYIKMRLMMISCQNEYSNLWIGITLPDDYDTVLSSDLENDVCVWTKLYNVPLGEHQFFIKTIRFYNNEIRIKLEHIPDTEDEPKKTKQKMKSSPNKQKSNNDKNDKRNKNNNNDDDNSMEDTFSSVFSKWKKDTKISLLIMFENFLNNVNKENVMSVMRFIAILIVSLSTFAIEAIKYIGSYTLKFMAECRLWVYTFTPIIIKLIDVLTKIIGGFYILIAMMWREAFGGNGDSPSEIVRLNMLTSSPPPRMIEHRQPRIGGYRKYNYRY